MRPFPLALFLTLGSALAAPELQVAYPPAQHSTAHDHTILEGHVSPGASLSIGGRPVAVGRDGLFMEWWPLRPGLNTLNLVAVQGGSRAAQTLLLTYNRPSSLPQRPSTLRPGSLAPAGNIELYGAPPQARSVQVRFQASPGGRASVQVGSQTQAMPEEAASETQAAGWYSAALNLPAGTFANLPVRFTFTGKDGKTLHATAPGRLSSEGLPRVAVVRAANLGLGVNPATTSFDTGPGAHDQLFPRQGERLVVWRQGAGRYTVQGITGPATAPAAALELQPAGTPPPTLKPAAPILTETPGEWQLRMPLGERVLFDVVEGQAQGGQQPAQATLSIQLAGANLTAGTLPPSAGPQVRWGGNGLSVTLPQPDLWGYWAEYQGTDLVLHIRKAPALDVAQPLRGHLILLDPGHGGDEFGGAGSLGTPEKDIVLPIALRVAELLRAQGADVRLTRDHDQKVALYDRPLMAEALGAELLVSIHANALPDGIDPRTHKGLEVHTYHPMTYDLARSLLQSIPQHVAGLGISSASSTERDPALSPGLMVSNLALTRPSTQRSLLIETAYLTDPSDLRMLMGAAGREGLAQGIAAGIAADYAARAARAAAAQPMPPAAVPGTPTVPALPTQP